ncbi:endonuclease/exonuclease/phosphatase family protein [Streptomyces hoynatensis]|uniref:endonuclease/exonuclease/phosphatase family protein n=1 Tax=Streptomyces hoynatensis TaxID=1141874 RepID=UPI001F4EBEA9|nr:endonuclease/exonuclease/phosphatase family protein [Streptomyces hoynatensis]
MSVELRLLAYNVRSLRDDRAALAGVIRACAPDVLCVQEAPRFPGWRLRAARLARATGLAYVTGGAPACGTMILAAPRATVERAQDVRLPVTPGLHRRGLAGAVLRFPGAAGGAGLAVLSCHLGLRAGERLRHAPLLRERLAALAREPDGRALPGIVAGDLNEPLPGPVLRLLTGAAAREPAAGGPDGPLRDAWAAAPEGGAFTFPAAAPARRIDAVLCTPGIEVLGCGVPEGLPGLRAADLPRASDHLPVLARLRVG